MSEFEIHQLILASRYEFDLATIFYVAFALAMIALAQSSNERWSRQKVGWSLIFYSSVSALIAIRCAASIVRF